MDPKRLIDYLELKSHPEGGWYRENYRSDEEIPENGLPKRYGGKRSFGTAIYFMLEKSDFSAFHRVKSDEIWHYYAGSSVIIHQISSEGKYISVQLGSDIESGQQFQYTVPAGRWFAAETFGGAFSLVGCTVAPGFDFADFEMADRETLLKSYPEHSRLISRLTRPKKLPE